MTERLGIGVIGCGNISDIYLKNITEVFTNIKLVCVADLDKEKAECVAKKYNTVIRSTKELITSEDVDIVLNITTPMAHRKICEMALMAGKHVYVEKPLSLNKEDGAYLLNLAKKKGLYIGGAPDTFLGGGIRTCKKLIEDGWIGDVIGANGFMVCHGHESWHPDPEFYYQTGGGPLFDMGPYYLTALVSLIGSIESVTAITSKAFKTRTITSEPKRGAVIDVEVPTHVVSLLAFENGATGQLTTSFDVWGSSLPRIEIYGTKGTIIVPDPNTFSGPIQIMTEHDTTFKEIPLAFDYSDNSRGIGISQMSEAIMTETPSKFKANGKMTYHVLEVMEAIHVAGKERVFIDIISRV